MVPVTASELSSNSKSTLSPTAMGLVLLIPFIRNFPFILHFSDLHLTPARKTEISDIKSFIDLAPDLVVSTGDFLAHLQAVPVALGALDQLLNLPGLFVFGSNDYYAPKPKNPLKYLLPSHGKRKHGAELPWPDLDKGLQSRGWINLNRSRATIKIKDTTIETRGTDDAHLEF